jgi:hypothetical protein
MLMAAESDFEALMRVVCEQWCLGQSMNEVGESSDLRRFIPETGTVTADQFVEWVFLASNPETLNPAPMWRRARVEIRAAFIRFMGDELVEASALCWPGGPGSQPLYLPLPNPEAFARNLTAGELEGYEQIFGKTSREWILARRELDRRR